MLAGLGVSTFVLSGCLYWDSVNATPVAVIDVMNEPAEMHVTGSYTLTCAKSHDPDGSQPSCAWSLRDAADRPRGQGSTGQTVGLSFTDELGKPSHLAVIVTLTVTDDHGAQQTTSRRFEPSNQKGDIVVNDADTNVKTRGNYTAGRYYEFFPSFTAGIETATADPDQDQVPFVWQDVVPPYAGALDAGVAGTVPGVSPMAPRYFVRPDAPGTWKLQISGDDGFPGGVSTGTSTITVDEDQPPCIEVVDPSPPSTARVILQHGTLPMTFRVVSVSDEMDVFPLPVVVPDSGMKRDPDLSETSLTWYIGPEDGSRPLAQVTGEHAASYFTVDPAAYPVGERLLLRVEANDRKHRTYCEPAKPPCTEPTSPACQQRFTWTLEVR